MTDLASIAIAADLLVKSAMICLLALGIGAATSRRPARTRSAFLHAGVIVLLLLPLAALALPRLHLGLWEASDTSPVAEPLVGAIPSDGDDPLAGEVLPVEHVDESAPPATSPSKPERAASATALPASATAWPAIFAVGYALGVFLLLVRVACSLVTLERLVRTARAVEDASWSRPLRRWRLRLGIARHVRLLSSEQITAPVTFGWLRPVIVVPDSVVDACRKRHRTVLLAHELSHIRRADYLWQLLVEVARVIYWPQPFVWLVARRVAEAREHACDDWCVQLLGSPHRYRDSLLCIAKTMTSHTKTISLGLAMSRRSLLASRIARLREHRVRGSGLPSRRATVVLVLAAVLLAGVVGALDLRRAGASPEPPSEPPGVSRARRRPPRSASAR